MTPMLRGTCRNVKPRAQTTTTEILSASTDSKVPRAGKSPLISVSFRLVTLREPCVRQTDLLEALGRTSVKEFAVRQDRDVFRASLRPVAPACASPRSRWFHLSWSRCPRCRRLATRRLLRQRVRCCVLVKSPSRTAISRRDAAQAAFWVTAFVELAINVISTSSSSTPPAGRVATTG